MGIDRYILARFRVLMTYVIIGIIGFFQLNSAFAFSQQVEVSYGVETFEFYSKFNDDFNSRILEISFSDFPVSILEVSMADNAIIKGVTNGAAKGGSWAKTSGIRRDAVKGKGNYT